MENQHQRNLQEVKELAKNLKSDNDELNPTVSQLLSMKLMQLQYEKSLQEKEDFNTKVI